MKEGALLKIKKILAAALSCFMLMGTTACSLPERGNTPNPSSSGVMEFSKLYKTEFFNFEVGESYLAYDIDGSTPYEAED